MEKSNEIKDLAIALCKAQSELSNPGFDTKNPFFKSKYASLKTVRNTVTPVLAANGIALTQLLGNDEEGNLACETVLIHSTGQWISSTLVIKGKLDAQGLGSAATYARRYSMMAICNIVGDPDDDGNVASTPIKTTPTKTTKTNQTISNEQKTEIKELLQSNGLLDDTEYMGKLLGWLKIDGLNDLLADKFGMAVDGINQKIKRMDK